MRKGGVIIFILYLLFGIYFINSALNFVSLPESFGGADKWITLIGGVLVLIGGINFLRLKRYKY